MGGISMLFPRKPRVVCTTICTTISSPVPISVTWTILFPAFIRAKQSFVTQYPRTHIKTNEATYTMSVVIINTILTRWSFVVLCVRSWLFVFQWRQLVKLVTTFQPPRPYNILLVGHFYGGLETCATEPPRNESPSDNWQVYVQMWAFVGPSHKGGRCSCLTVTNKRGGGDSFYSCELPS